MSQTLSHPRQVLHSSSSSSQAISAVLHEKIKAQNGRVVCTKSHSGSEAELEAVWIGSAWAMGDGLW